MDDQKSHSWYCYSQHKNHKFWYNCHFLSWKDLLWACSEKCFWFPKSWPSTTLCIAISLNTFPMAVYITLHCIGICPHYYIVNAMRAGTMWSCSVMNLQYIALCLAYMICPINIWLYSSLCNYIEAMASFPISISIHIIIAHAKYFREKLFLSWDPEVNLNLWKIKKVKWRDHLLSECKREDQVQADFNIWQDFSTKVFFSPSI